MAIPPRPSFPSAAPSEPSLRRLGVGGSGAGGDKPLRAQIIVALVAGLILIAVPLYLWRRPSAAPPPPADSAAPPGSIAPPASVQLPQTTGPDAGSSERVRLGQPQRVKCSAGGRVPGQEGGLCDQLPALEQALAKAIRENADCAPKTGKEGSINFVLTVDFTNHRLHVFPGASGSWHGPQARRATQCVKKAVAAPAWDSITHQYRYYSVAILATYAVPGAAAKAPPGVPLFE